MKINTPNHTFTHEGAIATNLTSYQQLRRATLACMLFEDTFYEDGKSICHRIKKLCESCSCDEIMDVALDASETYYLRHVPLQLIVEALKKPIKSSNISDIINLIIKRPDMMTDLLALYWKDGKKSLANQLKRGLAKAFTKFDEYQLSKYNRDNPIKLRDVLFLCHAKPKDAQQEDLWKRLINKTLAIADTWETRLSAGKDKKETFQQLLENNKLGKLAILRNLRNMRDAGLNKEFVGHKLLENTKPMLPFQYIAAAKEVPDWEDIIDPSMIQACAMKEKITGSTIVLVDVSGSMKSAISSKSKMLLIDAACGMAILLRECLDKCQILTFSENLADVPLRHGMALRDAIIASQQSQGTLLGEALKYILSNSLLVFERIIVITDEQSSDEIPMMRTRKNYILNIGPYKNGIGNRKKWTTITGFSEASIDYIREHEALYERELE